MADLYSVIPGLQPSSQELLEAELLSKQILEAQFPDFDLREGTGLRDLVLRPSAVLLATIKKATDYYFAQRTISGVDDSTPTDLVDSILSNWFLTRNIGMKSIISARLYFARRKNASISADIYFSTDNTLKFYPSNAATYSAAALTYDSYSDEYYIDVDMTAEKEGAAYNLSSGSLLYFSNFDPYFLRAEINYLKSEAIDSETNLQFIDRAKTAISTRNLINQPSVDSNLRANFNYLTRLLTVGYGDAEMLRDQLKAVFEDENPRSLTSLTSVGTVVTAVLANHGYNSGQTVQISNANPTGYNGTFVITVLDTSTFTYNITTTLGPVTSVPLVSAVNLPILVHNGGMVDIYCSDKLASSIVQLTADEFGVVNLTGPVYSFDRSSVTGGSDDDTIPVLTQSDISNVVISGTTVTVATALPHDFTTADTVTIAGAVQKQTATSMTVSGLTATVTLNNHGYLVGNTVKVTGADQTQYNGSFVITSVTTNSFNFTVPLNVVSPATGTIQVEVDLLNGPKTLISVSGSAFTYSIPQTSTVAVTGTITASCPTRYSTKNEYTETKIINTMSSAGKTVTVTIPHHGYSEGRYVTIVNSVVTAYNGTWLVDSVPNLDQFTFLIPNDVTATTNTGDAEFVIPWRDYGFSQQQSLLIDFGTKYAGKTASFEINYFQYLDSIQEYLDSATNRVLCGDYLARGLNFYQMSVELTSYDSTAPNSADAATIIDSYLSSLEAGGNFMMTDMVTKLRLNGITNIQNPPKVTFKKYTRDLGPVITGTVTDVLDPNDRTSVFLLDTVTTKAATIDQTTDAVII